MNQFNLPTQPHTLDNREQPTINARDLHERLGVGKMFAHWIKDRIEKYDFEEGVDFCLPNLASRENQSLSSRFGNLLAGENRKDYYLTLDMAKEIALVENNSQGRAIRRALIAMERQMREDVPALLRKLEKALNTTQQELLKAHPDWAKIEGYRSLGLNQTEISKLVDVQPSTLRRHLKRMAACQLVDYRPSRFHQQIGKLGREAQQINLALQEEGGVQ